MLLRGYRPLAYELHLQADLHALSFAGVARIELAVDSPDPQRRLQFHAKDLQLDEVFLSCEGDGPPCAVPFEVNDKEETCTVTAPKDLEAGKPLTLEVRYKGALNRNMHGFYAATYPDGRGGEAVMACTHFEPTCARMAFPCWDEPAYKAVFRLFLSIEDSLRGVANMEVAKVLSPEELYAAGQSHAELLPMRQGHKVLQFAETPSMSTYLVAFVVGDLECIERTTSCGTQVRVWTTPGKKQQGSFALDVASSIIPYYNEYFDYKYPLPKADLLAVPDFAIGAMENWGCITFRETALLYEEGQSAATSKQRISLVVCHELAHMWFGNLVTMEWWTDLWLKEGFANWIMYLATDHLFPDWNIWVQFVVADLGRALSMDSLRNTHPIEVFVERAEDVEEIFDGISYSKGCSLVRMLSNYMGQDALRVGMQAYLKEHAYGNAETQDLWNAFSKASGQDIGDVMNNWTRQPGYPVVSVEEASPGTFRLQQKRFFASREEDSGDQLWKIPLGYTTSEGGTHFHLMQEAQEEVQLPSAHDWVYFNAHQNGVYRVKYSADMYRKLASAVRARHPALGPSERIGLVGDAVCLCQAGHVDLPSVLEVLSSFAGERDLSVLLEIRASLSSVHTMLTGSAAEEPFRKLYKKLFGPVAAEVGWESLGEAETHYTTMVRPVALGMAIGGGHQEHRDEAISRFHRYMAGDESAVPPDLRSVVYRAGIENGGETEFRQVLDIYHASQLNEERVRCLLVLGATKEEKLANVALNMLLDSSNRTQDLITLAYSLCANRTWRRISWDFFREHFSELSARFGGSRGVQWSHLVSTFVEYFNDESVAQEAQDFFAGVNVGSAERSVAQAIEMVRSRAAWLKATDVPATVAILEREDA